MAQSALKCHATCAKITLLGNPSLVEGVTGAAKDVFDLVADEFLHFCAGGTDVFARVKFLGIF
jgi:hypothetical protein